MHKDTRLSGMDKLTKPPLLTSWFELKALVDLDGIAFPIWYAIGNSAALIFQNIYNLSRIYIFQWFAMFGGIRITALQLYLGFLRPGGNLLLLTVLLLVAKQRSCEAT